MKGRLTMSRTDNPTSRIAGFYKLPVSGRVDALDEAGWLEQSAASYLRDNRGLSAEVADRMTENVIGCQSLPLSVALTFRVNGRDVLVPMAVEEPSIVAAASNAAKRVRICGGFHGEADEPVMTAQIQLDDVPDPEAASDRIRAHRAELIAEANAAIPRMVARGGGCRDLDVRVLDVEAGVVVTHLYVAVGDAMGANVVDTVAEALAPSIQKLVGGLIGLRILSNLPLRRLARATAFISDDALGGADIAEGIVRATRFAKLDVFRAVTHNKGVMNGIDAVALALGQDWRAIEAGAHAYASMRGGYGPIATWERVDGGLRGHLEIPMPAATVGGSTAAHDGVKAAFELVRVEDARELAVIMTAAGLATNLSALRALASDGIQRGHMRLHRRKEAMQQARRKEEVRS